jgi:hypothetical protein
VGDFVVAMGSPARLANTGVHIPRRCCCSRRRRRRRCHPIPHAVHLCALAMMPVAVTCGVVSAVDRSFEEIDEGLAHSSSIRQVSEGRLARAA